MGVRYDDPVVFTNTVTLAGTASITGANLTASAAVARTQLAQDTLKPFPVPFELFRVWNAYETVLPGTSASDDLGLYGGTFATGSQLIRTYDVKNAGAVTLYARVRAALPAEYDAGQTITLRLKCGMVTTVASVSATVDVEAYKVNSEGGIGSDLCATSATTINSLTYANKDFTITETGLVAGDVFDIRITVAVNDSGTGTAVIAAIGSCDLLCDVRG